MAVISTLAVNIIAKTAGFTRGIRGTRKTMMSFNTTIQNTKRLLTGLIIGTGVIRGFKALLKVASEVTETMSKFNVVFRHNATEVKKWSLAFADSVGRSRKDVLSFMAELQDIFVPMGFARDEAEKFSKSLTQLGVDVASFNEKIDREVMRDFTSAIMGSHRATRKYGIAISESRIKQMAYTQGIKKSFAHLTDMEKIFLRYLIILNDTKDAQTDAIRTQDNYANQLKRMRAAVTNLQVEIGEKLLPVMVGLLKWTRDLIDTFRNMSVETVESAKRWGRLVISIGAFLLLLPKIVGALKSIVKAYKAVAAGQTVVQALAGPAGWATLATGAVIAAAAVISVNLAFDNMIRNMDTLSQKTGELKASGDLIKVTIDDIRQSLMMVGKGTGIIPSIRKLRDEIAKLRYSESQLAEFQLQRELGGRSRFQDPKLFKELDRFRAELADLQKKAQSIKLGKDIFDETRTSLEKYTTRLQVLNSLLKLGAINQETFNRATTAAKKDMGGTGKTFQSSGQFEVVRRALVSVTGIDSMAANPELAESKKQTALLQRIADQEMLS